MLEGYRGASVFIPEGWTPTRDNINALPAPLQAYIHDLIANCDPAGLVQENLVLKEENYALRARLKGPAE
jgi:hypothetical protein